jgi:hypothetical protein
VQHQALSARSHVFSDQDCGLSHITPPALEAVVPFRTQVEEILDRLKDIEESEALESGQSNSPVTIGKLSSQSQCRRERCDTRETILVSTLYTSYPTL